MTPSGVDEAAGAIRSFALPLLEGGTVVTSGNTPIQRAAEIVARAQAQAASVADEARAAGFAEGHAHGVEEGREAVAAATTALEQAASALAPAIAERLAEMERHAVELALALAGKILGAALDVRPDVVVSVVSGALRSVTERGRVVIEVRPEELELVRQAIEPVADALGGFGAIEVVGDRRVARGGCVVRTEEAEIEATIQSQLEQAGRVVRDALSGATRAR